MLDLLKNYIVATWIAPVITGLVVLIIPAAFFKLFRFKKDEKAINQVNRRYLDLIMPFITQKIDMPFSFATDVRDAIIQESGVNEKYVYSELELRNKIIIDIADSRFIVENEKKELIEFTYKTFDNSDFDLLNNQSKIEELFDYVATSDKKNSYNDVLFDVSDDIPDEMLDEFFYNKRIEIKPYHFKRIIGLVTAPVCLLFLSQLTMIITIIFDKRDIKPEDNILVMLPFLLGFISILMLALDMITKRFESKILKKRNFEKSSYSNYAMQRNRTKK